MNITFYINSSERDRISKSLSSPLSLSGSLKDECSVMNPIILVNTSNLSMYNYCYIPEFGRYYFISDMSAVRTGLWRVSLSVDVLMSFKSDILASSCIIEKQALHTRSNMLINDGSYINQVDTFNEIVQFSGGFNTNGEFVLVTAGAIG